MEKILVSYRMRRPGESADTFITLPMTTDHAKELMMFQGDSVAYSSFVRPLLNNMTMLQGYSTHEFLRAETARGFTRNGVGQILSRARP